MCNNSIVYAIKHDHTVAETARFVNVSDKNWPSGQYVPELVPWVSKSKDEFSTLLSQLHHSVLRADRVTTIKYDVQFSHMHNSH